MLGQHKRNFSLVPYRSRWKDLFDQEAELLQNTLGGNAMQIAHIGSTSISIPGMEAKPIMDITVAVVSLDEAKELIPALLILLITLSRCLLSVKNDRQQTFLNWLKPHLRILVEIIFWGGISRRLTGSTY